MNEAAERIMRHMASTLDDEAFAALYSPEGLAPTCEWLAEDDWIVSYTTKRIRAGRLDGLFATMIYKPSGRGSAKRWERIRLDRCDTRREAKQRALKFYYDHSPQKAAKHGWTGDGYAEVDS